MIVSMPSNDNYRDSFDRVFGDRHIKHGGVGKFASGRENIKRGLTCDACGNRVQTIQSLYGHAYCSECAATRYQPETVTEGADA